jgi:diguanylate cyclase (GGDEF)-like protein
MRAVCVDVGRISALFRHGAAVRNVRALRTSPIRILMLKFRLLTLRQMLTVPYVVLVLAAALAIGLLSYRTGQNAVNTLADYLLTETVGRISQAVERHVAGSGAVLETAFPTGVYAPTSVAEDIENLRTRFWLATSVHRDPNNYAYFGDRNGHFFGLWRFSETEAELRLRADSVSSPRKIYHFTGIRGALAQPRIEERPYDPRERPWYKAGQGSATQTWTSIYIDFKTLELVGTRARRVNTATGEFAGVVATDISLKHLSTFLRQLKLSPNGFAFIVEPDGNLIATSRGPHLKKGTGEDNQRLNAAASDDALIVATYSEVRTLMAKSDAATNARTSVFDGPDGEQIQMGYARVQDDAGLDWVIAVAVPRSDFLSGITENFKRTAWLAAFVSLLIIATGFVVLATVTADLRKLARLARDVGDGVFNSPLNIQRKDELGDLAKSFSDMQQRLLTDRLTGLANREALIRRIEEKIIMRRRAGDPRLFALLFIDLDRFKSINDTHGHDAGDQVLRVMGERMVATVRETDLVARYAGDEFIIMLDQIDNQHSAERVREQLSRKLAEPITIPVDKGAQPITVAIGASIGLACFPENAQDVDSLVKYADAEMYRYKNATRPG